MTLSTTSPGDERPAMKVGDRMKDNDPRMGNRVLTIIANSPSDKAILDVLGSYRTENLYDRDAVQCIRDLFASSRAQGEAPADEQIRKVYQDACQHADDLQQGYSYGRMQALRAVYELGRSTPPTPEAEPQALLGWTRYEKARKLNVAQWAELHQRNLRGENFDDMIDALPATTQPAQQDTVEALMAMTEEEIDAELRTLGIEPEEALRKGTAAIEGALAAISAHKQSPAAWLYEHRDLDVHPILKRHRWPVSGNGDGRKDWIETELVRAPRERQSYEPTAAEVGAHCARTGMSPVAAREALTEERLASPSTAEDTKEEVRKGFEAWIQTNWPNLCTNEWLSSDDAEQQFEAFKAGTRFATPPAEKQAAPSGEALLLMMRAQAERMPDMTQAEAIRLIDMALQDAKGAAS